MFISFHLFLWNKIFSALEHIFYFALVYILVCLGAYKLVFLCTSMYLRPNRRFDIACLINLIRLQHFKWPTKQSMKRVLVITSHPDDECMFFGPVIYSIVRNLDSKIYLLCLSHGKYENQVSKQNKVHNEIEFVVSRVLREDMSYGMLVKS